MPFLIRPSRRLPFTYLLGFISLITILFLSSGPAYAEWVSVENKELLPGLQADLLVRVFNLKTRYE